MGSVPGLGRFLGEGNGNSVQYSFLGNPMDKGDWQATVQRVSKSRTWLKWPSTRAHIRTQSHISVLPVYSKLTGSIISLSLTFVYLQFSRSVVSDSLRPHGLQHARPACSSPTPGVYLNACPLSRWCHPTISSSVFPFSSHLQSFPASGSFPMSRFFTSGGQSIGVSASASVLLSRLGYHFQIANSGYPSNMAHHLVFSEHQLHAEPREPNTGDAKLQLRSNCLF